VTVEGQELARLRGFDHLAAMTGALADQVTASLARGIEARGQASLVVSGGRSPEALFGSLSGRDLDWAAVTVTLADERWLPPGSPDSNERLVRDNLLVDRAAEARFVGLWTGHDTPEAGEAACAERLIAVPRPFDQVLLGMGEDGHTASLFPGAEGLSQALGADAGACRAMRAPGAPQPRMTLTLPSLLDAREIFVVLQGDAKRRVYERALADGPVEDMPIRAVLRQDQTPVTVYWSP
jgi:6-phosphogluconolactonase